MDIRTEKIVSVVTPRFAQKLQEAKMRWAALNTAGYASIREWHPTVPEGWGVFPQVPFEVSEIYHGSKETFAYSHHQSITKFGNRYVASWSNAPVDEDKPGQEIHFASSLDGRQWTPDRPVVTTDPESGLIRSNAGSCSDGGVLYNYVVTIGGAKDSKDPSLTSFVPDYVRLDVYVTRDLERWEERTGVVDNCYLFEGPRKLADGTYMCSGRSFLGEQQPIVLLWKPGQDLASSPEVIPVPEPDRRIRGLQGTWYQTDGGRIWMYLRDAGLSARLAVSCSDDGGRSWSDELLTDMPNTFSRAHCGRLSDGRYYLIGNNSDVLLDRSALQVAISDDGSKFDRMYTLVEGKTHRRCDGLHKEDGWHYPNSIVDGDKLVVIFSVNKEDIRCGIVDSRQLA